MTYIITHRTRVDGPIVRTAITAASERDALMLALSRDITHIVSITTGPQSPFVRRALAGELPAKELGR